MYRKVCFALVTCLAVTLTLSAESPTPGKQVPASATVKVKSDGQERDATLRFFVALPADYDKDQAKRWPLVLFLHGAGERGDDLEIVKKHGPPKLVAQGKEFPFVLISPQCPSGTRWNPHELANLLDHAANTYRIDRQRIYVTGLSMGGAGTWSLLAEYPGKCAAAIPICGRGDVAAAEKLAKTPIRIFVGAKDRAETVKNCEDMAAALKKAGGDVDLKVYPDLPHDCWTVTYDNPQLYEWLLSQRLPASK
jgi:predicted peptidase